MHRVKKFDVLSVAKISGLCYGAMGLLFVPFFLLFGMVAGEASKQAGGMPPGFAAMFSAGMAVMMPIIYAVMGFIFGALGAFVYNLISGWVGGIEVELEPLAIAPVSLIQRANT
jgi:hypothetical protein